MTQNLKSLLKLAFKKSTKTTKKKKIKSLLFNKIKSTKSSGGNTKSTTTTTTMTTTANYLTRYNCKNKRIDISGCSGSVNDEHDDTISNLLPAFKAIPTQILIPPPSSQQPQPIDSVKLIEYKLTNATKSKPANIPMLIIKSYKANATVSLQQISVGKGSAVNALYMLSNSWVFIKTFDDREGYIPKHCCGPFATGASCSKNKTTSKISIAAENTNHTYISIIDNNNSNETVLKEKTAEETEQEYEDENDIDEITNLSLFSVSRCVANFDSTITSYHKKTTIKGYSSKKFYFKSTIANKQYNLRRKSTHVNNNNSSIINKQRENRKQQHRASVFNKQIPNELTLTMLENHHHKQQQQQQNNRVQKKPPQQPPKRIISSNSLSSGTTTTSSSSSSSIGNYDLLMKCTSQSSNKKDVSRIVLYKCVHDYTADFKDDINVKKGDIVYSTAAAAAVNNNDWIFVKPYSTINDDDTDNDCGGFIPRSYVMPL